MCISPLNNCWYIFRYTCTATWRCDLGSGHAAVKQQRCYYEFMIGTVYIPMHLLPQMACDLVSDWPCNDEATSILLLMDTLNFLNNNAMNASDTASDRSIQKRKHYLP